MLSLKYVNIKHFKIQEQNYLKSKDSESIEWDPISYYRFTTNDILLYDMINIMFLNMMVSF